MCVPKLAFCIRATTPCLMNGGGDMQALKVPNERPLTTLRNRFLCRLVAFWSGPSLRTQSTPWKRYDSRKPLAVDKPRPAHYLNASSCYSEHSLDLKRLEWHPGINLLEVSHIRFFLPRLPLLFLVSGWNSSRSWT